MVANPKWKGGSIKELIWWLETLFIDMMVHRPEFTLRCSGIPVQVYLTWDTGRGNQFTQPGTCSALKWAQESFRPDGKKNVD